MPSPKTPSTRSPKATTISRRTRNPAPPKAVAASPAETPAATPKPTPTPAPATMTGPDAPEKFRRPDLIDAVAARTELKRTDAKAVLELVLDELGQALDTRDELALQPLGSLSVKRRKPVVNGDMLTVKIKRRKGT